MKRQWTIAALVGVVVLSGCSGGDPEDLPQRDMEDTAAAVLEASEDAGEAIGAPMDPSSLRSIACTGQWGETQDTVYSVRGEFHFIPEEDELAQSAERLKDYWEDQGWKISDYRTPGQDVIFDARDPETDWNYTIHANAEEKWINAPIHTTCYHDPDLDGDFGGLNDRFPEVDWSTPDEDESESPSADPSESEDDDSGLQEDPSESQTP